MADDARVRASGASETPGFMRHVNIFFEDRSLWPLLFIFVVHVALAGALLLLAALRTGSLPALAALAVLLTLSADAVRRTRRRRWVALWLVTLWGLSAATAVLASAFGLL